MWSFIAIFVTIVTSEECPGDWVAAHENCYFVSDAKLSKREARNECRRMDAELLLIANKAENEFIKSIMKKATTTWLRINYVESYDEWHIDEFKSRVATGNYMYNEWTGNHWSGAFNVTYENWGNFNSIGDNTAAIMKRGGSWFPEDEYSKSEFICQMTQCSYKVELVENGSSNPPILLEFPENFNTFEIRQDDPAPFQLWFEGEKSGRALTIMFDWESAAIIVNQQNIGGGIEVLVRIEHTREEYKQWGKHIRFVRETDEKEITLFDGENNIIMSSRSAGSWAFELMDLWGMDVRKLFAVGSEAPVEITLNPRMCKPWSIGDGGFQVVPGYLHETVPILFSQWHVAFELHNYIKASSASTYYDGNVLTLGQRNETDQLGTQLSVDIISGWLRIGIFEKFVNLRAVQEPSHLKHNWIKVDIAHVRMANNVFRLTVKIDDEVLYYRVSDEISEYPETFLYASVPGRRSAQTVVKNLAFKTWPYEATVATDTQKRIGGCKEGLTQDDYHSDMLCKKTCVLKDIGREADLKLKMMMITETNVMAQITVSVNSKAPYVGILRLEEQFCSPAMLDEVNNNGKVRFNVGDKTDPNYWLESISYIKSGGGWILSPPSLYVQYRRGKKMQGEMMKGKRDVVLISLASFDSQFTREQMETCLKNTHLSFMKNDKKLAYSNDYTRCAAFEHHDKKPNWPEKGFLPRIGILESRPDMKIGGCKELATFGRTNADLLCSTECGTTTVGKVKQLNFQWISENEEILVGEITLDSKPLTKWLLRFDEKVCRHSLLVELASQNAVRFDVGENSLHASSVELDSVTYSFGIGEQKSERATFAQFTRNEVSSKKLLLIFNVFAPEKFTQMGVNTETLRKCMMEASLFQINDNSADQNRNDYTRCAAFKHYNIDIDWTSSSFLSTFPTTQSTTPKSPIIPVGVKCKRNPFSSGESLHSRIVGGEETKPLSWPWIARMQYDGSAGCAGTILNNQWILTAASCCDSDYFDDDTVMSFLIGDHNYTQFEGTEQEVIAQQVFMHRGWTDCSNYCQETGCTCYSDNFDYCLVKTNEIILDGDSSDVVCLPIPNVHINPNDNALPNGPNCFIAGWGSTQEKYYRPWIRPEYNSGNWKHSETLQSANVNIFSASYCESNADSMRGYFDPEYEFCAGFLEGGRDSCIGDAGGPLICINKKNEPVLYGIVSWGDSCGSTERKKPGVYAKVAPAMGWIKEIIKNNS